MKCIATSCIGSDRRGVCRLFVTASSTPCEEYEIDQDVVEHLDLTQKILDVAARYLSPLRQDEAEAWYCGADDSAVCQTSVAVERAKEECPLSDMVEHLENLVPYIMRDIETQTDALYLAGHSEVFIYLLSGIRNHPDAPGNDEIQDVLKHILRELR